MNDTPTEADIMAELRQQLLEYGYIAWFAGRHAENKTEIAPPSHHVANLSIVLGGIKEGETADNNLGYYAEKLRANRAFLDRVKRDILDSDRDNLTLLTG